MDYYEWPPYVSVAERRRKAAKEIAKLKRRNQSVSPVTIAGRLIATSFWGKSWCSNLDRYSDYQNRLPRGRSYVRNGSVVDLQIAKGKVSSIVSGTDLYTVTLTIAPVPATRWKAICRDCVGAIDSLVELLQGRLSKSVMDRVCREGDGLFPAPKEIKLSCSCPDWADMCKHVAAVLYGIGARLDEKPALLFQLRGVNENELLANAGNELLVKRAVPATAKVLDDSDVASLFGLEMAEAVKTGNASPKRAQPRKPSSGPKTHAGEGAVAYQARQPKTHQPARKSANRIKRDHQPKKAHSRYRPDPSPSA